MRLYLPERLTPPQPGWRGGCAGGLLHSNSLPFFCLGPNPSEPLSSSTQWAGHQSRSCLHLCGHPHPGGGPCSPASSGAESLIPNWPPPVSSHCSHNKGFVPGLGGPLLLCPVEPLKLLAQPGLALVRPRSSPTRCSPGPGPAGQPHPPSVMGHLKNTGEETSFWMFMKKVCRYGAMATLPPCRVTSAHCSGPWSEDGQGWSDTRSSSG